MRKITLFAITAAAFALAFIAFLFEPLLRIPVRPLVATPRSIFETRRAGLA